MGAVRKAVLCHHGTVNRDAIKLVPRIGLLLHDADMHPRRVRRTQVNIGNGLTTPACDVAQQVRKVMYINIYGYL
jgi:hypothetical protein